jgi:hypothetical protein
MPKFQRDLMPRRSVPLLSTCIALALTASACIDEATLREYEAQLATEQALAVTQQALFDQPRPTSTPRPTRVPVAGQNTGDTWTIMLYQDADDEILEQDIFLDLNEAEVIGSTDQVRIVSQIDRYAGAYRADGNWTGTRRYVLEQDNNLTQLASPFEDIGETNMADASTLVDFVAWAAASYPADHYVLILSDHGMGWPGGWNDPDPGGRGRDNVSISRAFGDLLYMMELDRALAEIRTRTGIQQFELIGFDACLMAHIEVFAAIQPYAHYAVASQEVEPGIGWSYAAFLNELVQNPSMSGRELAGAIVGNYIDQDLRILDDQLRLEYLNGRTARAEVVAEVTGRQATLSAIDLQVLPGVMTALDGFAQAANQLPPRTVARARTYAQPFQSIFGTQVPPSYIDLAHFAALTAQESGDQATVDAARNLLDAMGAAIVSEKSGPERPGAYGISIYFPNADLYQTTVGGPQSYGEIATRFAQVSLWDDFLFSHYTGRPLPQRSETLPALDVNAVVAPGSSPLDIDPIAVAVNPEGRAVLSTQIRGQDIGYIYLFVGYYNAERNAILFADQDFVEAPNSRQVNGVYFPDWGTSGVVDLAYTWDPVLYAISDGQQTVPALINPETYGATVAESTYSTDGIFNFGTGETATARLIWDSQGNLRAIYGYTNADFTGAPSEITPQRGDTFTLLDTWYDVETQEYRNAEGATLTFGTTPWRYTAYAAPAGAYNIGFVVEDLQGGYDEAYVDVELR